jgi:hypothetical protein
VCLIFVKSEDVGWWVDDAFLYMFVLAAATPLNAVCNSNICVFLSHIANMKIQGEEIYGATVPLNKSVIHLRMCTFLAFRRNPF